MDSSSINGIICFVYGGLGNQLFQAIAGYLVSKKKDITNYILKNNTCKHKTKKYDYYDLFLKDFGEQLEINNEKIVLEAKNNLVFSIEELEVKKQIPNLVQPVIKGKPIPYGSGLTPEMIEKNRLWIRPCSTTESVEKKEKQSNGFRYAKFTGYY